MKKMIHIAAVAVYCTKEVLEWILASAVHMAFWILMFVMTFGIGGAAALFLYGGWSAYMELGEATFALVLHFGCLLGIAFAISQRVANFLSRLDIRKQKEAELAKKLAKHFSKEVRV